MGEGKIAIESFFSFFQFIYQIFKTDQWIFPGNRGIQAEVGNGIFRTVLHEKQGRNEGTFSAWALLAVCSAVRVNMCPRIFDQTSQWDQAKCKTRER